MDWQDTVMSREAVNKVITPGSEIPLWADYGPTHPDYILLSRQAQLSFEAGQQEGRREVPQLNQYEADTLVGLFEAWSIRCYGKVYQDAELLVKLRDISKWFKEAQQ